MDIFLKNNQLIIYIAIALVVGIVFIWLRIRAIQKRKSVMATTALMSKQLSQRPVSTGGMQFELRASEYGIEESLSDIKKNLNRISFQRNEIIELFDELKEKIQKDVKIEEVKVFVDQIKIKVVEIEAKTNQFCSEENVKRFENELPKITSATRIMFAKDKRLTMQDDDSAMMKSAAQDVKHYLILLKTVRELPKEIKSFIAFIETQLKAVERKIAEYFSKQGHSVTPDKKMTDVLKKMLSVTLKGAEKKTTGDKTAHQLISPGKVTKTEAHQTHKTEKPEEHSHPTKPKL